jgi:hypothetical protein
MADTELTKFRIDFGHARTGGGGFTSNKMDPKPLKAALKRVEGLFGDLRPVWPFFRMAFFHIEQFQFASQGAAGGAPWRPVHERYQAWKSAHGFGSRTLVAQGTLEASLTSEAAESIYRPMARELQLGTSNRAGFWQKQEGRPPIDITSKSVSLFGTASAAAGKQAKGVWEGRTLGRMPMPSWLKG